MRAALLLASALSAATAFHAGLPHGALRRAGTGTPPAASSHPPRLALGVLPRGPGGRAGRRTPQAPRMALKEGDKLRTPETLQEMMVDAAAAVAKAAEGGASRMSVEVPLPITGGTELDDWPGGIKQKYGTMRPMVAEMMKSLNFTRSEMEAQKFLGYVDDAIGIWEGGDNMAVVCFPTTEVAKELMQLADAGKRVVVVNSQFFIDPFSSKEGKDWDASMEKVYLLQSLNLKGPGLLPVKGVMLRTYPDPFTVARKVEGGDREVIATYPVKPERKALEELFFADSEERDSGLSLFDRLKRIQQEASNI